MAGKCWSAGTLCGLWNGLLVSRGNIQPMVATLVLMVAGRGIAQLITSGQIITVYYTPYFWLSATASSWRACRSHAVYRGRWCFWSPG
jgi:ribose/xylose/arabinose/galactoside ABC-type transport system permease subunit